MKCNGIIAFIGGALVGAATAILLAPDSGENTRRKLKDKAEQEYNNLKEKVAKAKWDCNAPDCECD